MSNNFFSFRQFTVRQDKCAMKVCTDACILGAWTAAQFRNREAVNHILDIGAGTGLLSLMLAQQLNAEIDAVEINGDAATQAKENILQSPFKDHINVINCSLQHFQTTKKYDLIISNPPFFEDDLKSPDYNKTAARHDSELRLDELIYFIKHKLNDGGSAVVLLPFHRAGCLSALLKEHYLFINETLFIKQSPRHNYFRSVMLFSNYHIPPIESKELTVKEDGRNYTEDFKELLSPYYLKL